MLVGYLTLEPSSSQRRWRNFFTNTFFGYCSAQFMYVAASQFPTHVLNSPGEHIYIYIYIYIYIKKLDGLLPPISHASEVRRIRHSGHCWKSKDELISDILLWTPTHGCSSVGQSAKTYIYHLCMDMGCCLEDLPVEMDCEREREGPLCCMHD